MGSEVNPKPYTQNSKPPKDSYCFMETTLLDRQQRLAEELPEQRHNFNALLHCFWALLMVGVRKLTPYSII